MKNIILALMIVIPSSFVCACEPNEFRVYYIPFDIDLYVPATREYILAHGDPLNVDTSLLGNLFKLVDTQEGRELRREDYASLRLLIINDKSGEELFFTKDKVLLSLSKKKRFNINSKLTINILKGLR